MIPGSLTCNREPLDEIENVRLGPRERDIEPAARHGAALCHQNRTGDEISVVCAAGADRRCHDRSAT
jgi:hypothetical protein